MNEKISIIVPIYNVEQYLVECLESLYNQSYQNCEILLIDDGSTDQSQTIVQKFYDDHSDKDIHLITKDNGGQSSARNLGMQKASGTYIIFVDSDDLITTRHVEMLYNAVKEKNAKVAMCKMTKNITELSDDLNGKINVLSGDFLTLVNKLYASNYPSASACAKIYHHTVLKVLDFYEGIIYEDGLFFYEVINQVNEVVLLDVASYYYRTAENSTMTSRIREKNFDILKQNELVYDFFEKNHPEAFSHFYQKALNANDYTAVKCITDNGKLSKELMKELYFQNKKYSKKLYLRRLLYLFWPSYYASIFLVSKVYAINNSDKKGFVWHLIKKITS